MTRLRPFTSRYPTGLLLGTVVPLLAVPQLTHDVLDGVLWRRRSNPRVGRLL